MSDKKEQLDALNDIRHMMKQSSKFLSLSGFSGVGAGVIALIGAYIGNQAFEAYLKNNLIVGFIEPSYNNLVLFSFGLAAMILVLSLFVATFFSARKAKKNGYKLFDHTSFNLVVAMGIPLLTGGVFSTFLIYYSNDFVFLISPLMLIFYGLSLVNASKYTYHEIKVLGMLELVLGLVATLYLGHGLLFWSIGFGVLHIIYGFIVWFRHDRNK